MTTIFNDFTRFCADIAIERHKKHYRYYKLNQRAFKNLNLPNLHFYVRAVKIANFQTGGNISRQFKYFGGHWNRQAIYKNMAKLNRAGYIKQDEKKKRLFKPIPGHRRHYINQTVLNHVRTRKDTLYLKYLLFIVNYRGNIAGITHREIKGAGFCTETADFLYRYIRGHLNKTRLKKLYNAVSWAFRKVGRYNRRVLSWIKGAVPFFKFKSNVPNWRQSPGTYNILKDFKYKTSNAPPRNGEDKKTEAERGKETPRHPDKTGGGIVPGDCLQFGTLDLNLKKGTAPALSGIEKMLEKRTWKGKNKKQTPCPAEAAEPAETENAIKKMYSLLPVELQKTILKNKKLSTF